jgi:hypothetical protein
MRLDQFWTWREKPAGSHLEIPAELYGAVMSLGEPERLNRQTVNDAVSGHHEARREGRIIWVYFSGHEQRRPGDPNWAKLFASPEAAKQWFSEHDPRRGLGIYA